MEGTVPQFAKSASDEIDTRREKSVDGPGKGSTRPPKRDRSSVAAAKVESAPTPRGPVEITLQSLLEAGVHFGHQTSRWSPAMAHYIYTQRNGIHIIHLPRTIQCWDKARKVVVDVVANGGNVLFVGTKKQAHDAVVEEARRCGAFYVSRRWLGGMMTNFPTIRKSIDRMNKLGTILAEEDAAQTAGTGTKFTKKERLMMSREREKLDFSLGGIKDMYTAPDLMFVVDIKREDIAIKEAKRLDIPVVALVDTNCDPRQVTYPIPSNDDGTRAIKLFCSAIADAVLEGKKRFAERPPVQNSSVETRRGARNRTNMAAHPVVDAAEFVEPAAEPAAEAAPVEGAPATAQTATEQ